MHALFLIKISPKSLWKFLVNKLSKSSHKIPTNQQNKIEKTPIFVTHTHLNITKDYFAL
jgi:hypothetical protein